MTGQNLARALFIIGFQAVPGVHELLGEQFIELFPEAIVDNHEPLDFLVRRPAGLFCRIGHVVMQVVHPKQGLELPRGFASAPIRADHDVRAEVLAQRCWRGIADDWCAEGGGPEPSNLKIGVL